MILCIEFDWKNASAQHIGVTIIYEFTDRIALCYGYGLDPKEVWAGRKVHLLL